MDSASETNTNLPQLLIDNIKEDDFRNFKKITKSAPPSWPRVKTPTNSTLLHEAMRYKSTKIFDYVLSFLDPTDLEEVDPSEQTPLMFAISRQNEHFSCELIKKGADIHRRYKLSGKSYLHEAVEKKMIKVIKLLLDKDVDVNSQDHIWRRTPLHEIILKRHDTDTFEIVSMLLYYGANATIECDDGLNAFEISVLKNHWIQTQDVLFDHTFDRLGGEIYAHVLMRLIQNRSHMFVDRLYRYNVQCVCGEFDLINCGNFARDLMMLPIDDFRIFVKKCHPVICEILGACSKQDIRREFFRNYDHLDTRLNLLMQNGESRDDNVFTFIENFDWFFILFFFKKHRELDAVTELLVNMLQYGFKWNKNLYDLIYTHFGYCSLFKLLLHSSPQLLEAKHHPELNNVMSVLIYDYRMDLDALFKNPYRYFCVDCSQDLMDFFAHPKLPKFLRGHRSRWKLSEDAWKRVEAHPRVPLLVELARNALRKYLGRRFNVKSTKQFYYLIDCLPVPRSVKKIITFETKLYNVK